MSNTLLLHCNIESSTKGRPTYQFSTENVVLMFFLEPPKHPKIYLKSVCLNRWYNMIVLRSMVTNQIASHQQHLNPIPEHDRAMDSHCQVLVSELETSDAITDA